MATASAVTAWGKPTIKSGASGESGALGTTLEDVGKIKENTTSLELVKGNVNELFGEGHELVDKMELEGTWTLKFTVIKASLDKIAKFFGLSVSTDKLAMKTTIVSEPRSYTVDPLLVGAIGAELPYCYTSITPKFATAEGWTIEFEVTTMEPESESVAPATLYVKKEASKASSQLVGK